ncbi:MAG: lipoprotein chaperone [Rickettsiaceae bacterium]|jgi:outer membrane lipoprotein-sorting protein|nr:lipoprotein chaperone [Rickettsiaceae bacterium]
MFRFLLAFLLFFGNPNSLLAKPGTDFISQNKVDLLQIENYLNNIKFLKATFVQEAPSGNSSGKFFLARPGKMRIEYEKPSPLLIVARDNVLAYSDLELDETSYVSTNSTPASFLTRKNFSFSAKDVEVVGFEKNDNFIRVAIVKKNKKEAGTFTLVFQRDPLKFVKMEVKNDLDEVTKVSFTTTKFDEAIDDKMFIVKNKNLPE